MTIALSPWKQPLPCALIYGNYQFLPKEDPIPLEADSWGRYQLLGETEPVSLVIGDIKVTEATMEFPRNKHLQKMTTQLRGGCEEIPAGTKLPRPLVWLHLTR